MERVSQYLLVVYVHERDDEPPIAPGRVARTLDRSPSATTEMLQRLADDDLLAYEPYDGVELTEQGRDRAADLYDTYRTLSTFFEHVLDLDDPDREARELADTVSPTVAQRLDDLLLGGDRVAAPSGRD